jgi:hypothetical protein
MPPSFVLVNVYVASFPAAVDFISFSFALETFVLALDTPVAVVGDFNAHLRTAKGTVPTPRDRDFQDFVAHMDGRGFSFFPSTPAELAKPTFISKQGSTVID